MKKIVTLLSIILILSLLEDIYTIHVNAETKVKSIKITSMPNKRAYNISEGYSTTGMVVVATMSDGKKETVDNSKITSFSGVQLTEGRPFTVEGYKSVTIRYKGAKATFGIAVFNPSKEYNISFNSDGGSKITSIRIDASTKEFDLPVPTKKGCQFSGWYHSNGIQYTKFKPGMGPSLQFKAKWKYSIIFNANGGSGTMQNGIIDKSYIIPKNAFQRPGYKFIGWSTKKNATDDSHFYEVGDKVGQLTNVKKSVTLYAQWVKVANYKITYVSVKDAIIPGYAIKTYTSGKRTTLPKASVVGNKKFYGWMINMNGKKYGPTMQIPPFIKGDIKLTPFVTEFEG